MGVVWRENSSMNFRERKQEGIFRVKERHHVKVALKHKIGKEINVFFFPFSLCVGLLVVLKTRVKFSLQMK